MTTANFDATRWTCGMTAEYKGTVYPIASCDFGERLIALVGVVSGTDDLEWVRCENVTIV